MNNYFNQLKQAIPLVMEECDIPGFSISVCDKEKNIFSEAFGFIDLSKNTPITASTQFSIQSISKMYTAFGFMLALQDNKVSLDDPIKKYIPDFFIKHKNNVDYSSAITFRQCLTHRTGLRHEALIGNNFCYNGTFDDHIKSINGTFLRYTPSEQYSYSNLGIDLVAYSLGKIYQMPFEDYMQVKVFDPLEMKFSTYQQKKFQENTDNAVGHDTKSLMKKPILMLGAGGMYSCPTDMTHFIRCVLNNGIYNGRSIIKQNLLEQMYTEFPASSEWPYNLGLVAGIIKNRTILNHNGGGFGFLSTQDIVLDGGYGVAALTNSVKHSNKHIEICRNMWNDLFSLIDEKKKDCTLINKNHNHFIGVYEAIYEGGSCKISVIPRNGSLYCNNQKLSYYSGNIFFSENNDCIEFFDNFIILDNVKMKCIRK